MVRADAMQILFNLCKNLARHARMYYGHQLLALCGGGQGYDSAPEGAAKLLVAAYVCSRTFWLVRISTICTAPFASAGNV